MIKISNLLLYDIYFFVTSQYKICGDGDDNHDIKNNRCIIIKIFVFNTFH